MDVNFTSPFKKRHYFNNEGNYINKSAQFNLRQSVLSLDNYKDNNNSDLYSIYKLKNDLRNRCYINNINNNDINNNFYLNKNNEHQMKHYIFYVNYFFSILKPFSEDINIKNLSYDIPLIIYVIFIFLKFASSKKINSIHLCLLILLPLFAHISINRIITKKYINFIHFKNKKKFFHRNFFKIFFNGYTVFILGFIITKLFNELFYRNKLIIHCFYLIYSAFIAKKILLDFIASLVSFNNKKIVREIISKKEGIKIYFIFFIVYSLISYIIEL